MLRIATCFGHYPHTTRNDRNPGSDLRNTVGKPMNFHHDGFALSDQLSEIEPTRRPRRNSNYDWNTLFICILFILYIFYVFHIYSIWA